MITPESGSWRPARQLAIALSIAVVALWFLYTVVDVVLLVVAVGILAIMLNAPVTWLVGRGWKRGTAAGVVGGVTLGVMVGVVWLVVPNIIEQATQLGANLPTLVKRLEANLAPILSVHPALEEELTLDAIDPSSLIGSVPALLGSLGRMSLSIIGGVIVMILVLTTVIYIVLDPRPILRFYLRMFPQESRDAAETAFTEGSRSVVGWIWANTIIGAGQAVVTTIFLTMMGIPGAFVWGVLAFFAELIPKVGGYLMAIPPVLVALAIDPMTAVWVALYFVVLNIIGGDVIAPRIRSTTMKLHPAYLVIMMLAMGTAFGILGAILATPVAGFVSAYIDAFILKRQRPDPTLDGKIDRMVTMTAPDHPEMDRQRTIV